MRERELIIRGMSCGHCVMAVRNELEKVDGLTVERVEIGRAVIRYDDSKIDDRKLAEVIDEAGYELEQ